MGTTKDDLLGDRARPPFAHLVQSTKARRAQPDGHMLNLDCYDTIPLLQEQSTNQELDILLLSFLTVSVDKELKGPMSTSCLSHHSHVHPSCDTGQPC